MDREASLNRGAEHRPRSDLASGSSSATLTSRHGSSSSRARMIKASPKRPAQIVTSRLC